MSAVLALANTLSEQAQTALPEYRDHSHCESLELPRATHRDGEFWTKVLVTDCCWLWTRARFPGTGYGAFWRGGKLHKAHRIAYELTFGPPPVGLDVMHICDVRHCVRPDHIRPGSRQENQRDMVAKGRHDPHGGRSKLTREQVVAIRWLREYEGRTLENLATLFGVGWTAIWAVVNRKTWKHVP
jgi:hypothetical protein